VRSARTVDVDELAVDFAVTGCVAVDGSGARLGKGGGFRFEPQWPPRPPAAHTVVTTVHELQVLDSGAIPTTLIHVDLIAFDRAVRCARPATGRSLARVGRAHRREDRADPLLERRRPVQAPDPGLILSFSVIFVANWATRAS
jgi:hypothetical protein